MEIKVQSLKPHMDYYPHNKEVEQNILDTVKTYLGETKENLTQKVFQRLSPLQNEGPSSCLCTVLSPLVSICSLLGLFPVHLDKGTCVLSYNCISKPGLVNVAWLIITFLPSCVMYSRVMNFFHLHVVNGTDFYTFGLVFLIQIAASVVIFLCGNFKASKFVQAWNAFHQVVKSVEMDGFITLKARIYIIPAYLLHDILLNMLTGFWALYTNPTIDTRIVVMMPLAGFLVTFIPGLLTCAYVVMLWILGEHFKTITKRVRGSVEDNSIPAAFEVKGIGCDGRNDLAAKLLQLRLQHEKLAIVVRHLEDAFGIQILAIFVASSFGFVSGVYGLIVFSQGLTHDDRFATLTAAYSIENVYGGVRLLLILLASQYLTNAAKAPANILNDMECKSDLVQIQVDRFLAKLGNFPVQVSCCDIFKLGNCFLAAAASNVVTYVLVLMQFRLDKCASTIPTSTLSNSSVLGIPEQA